MRLHVCKFEDILIYYACSLYLMCIVQNVLTYIYIFIYVYITVRLVFFFFIH